MNQTLLRSISRRISRAGLFVTALLGLSGLSLGDMTSINKDVWKMKFGVADTQINDGNWLNADSDGDGIKNKDEIAAGTNPFSPSATINVTGIDTTTAPGNVVLSFPTQNGKRYRAECTSSLTSPNWVLQPQPTPVAVTGNGGSITITIPYTANCFYRIRVDDNDADGDGVSDWAEKIAGYDANSAMTNGITPDATSIANAIASSNQVSVTVVKASATQPSDALSPPVDTGSITITRSGPLDFNSISVPLQKSGSALEGVDYDGLVATADFTPGVRQIVLAINPKFNASRRSNVTAIVKALAGTGYTLGAASGGVVINPGGTANGAGLTGQYHNTSSSTYATQQTIFAGGAEMTRVDPTIDFNGIASISTGNPCTVTTVYPHGLANGTPVTISGVGGGSFSPTINGIFTATVTGPSTFTVASNCTSAPTSVLTASVCGVNGITAVSTTGNPTTVTTKVPHNFGANGTQVPVSINWLNGGSFGSSINSTFTATVTGTSTFTIPISCTSAPSSSQLSVATLSGPAGVNGWGATGGPTGMSSPATGGAWSVRWTGQVLPQYSETYTFDVRSNASAKLWVNGQLLVDRWAVGTSVQEYVNKINLKAGTLYDIQIDYYMGAPAAGATGNAEMRLYWWSPTQPKQIVPQGRLFPAPASIGLKATQITNVIDAVGYVGTAFSLNISTPNTGGTISYAVATDSGPLPPGLSLNAGTGAITGTPTQAGAYNVAINAVNTGTGNTGAVTGSSVINFTIFPAGSLTRETLSGSTITANGTIPTIDDDTDYPDNTSRRLRGYLIPPKTGNYYFWIAANNTAEFWLSNDSEAVNRVRRSWTTSSTGNKTWNAQSTQRSPWLSLVAGRKYYFEVLHNTGTDTDDYVSVGWCQDDIGTVPAVIGDPNPNGLPPVISNGGAALQGYPLSGTVPSYIFQPYDYPVLTPSTGTLYAANLGPQGSANTKASGSCNLQLNAAQTQAILHFSYQNLSTPRTAYHLHTDAFASHPAGEIVFDIDDIDAFHPELRTADGGYIWNLAAGGTFSSVGQIVTAITTGKIYLNIHSVSFPNGEIRGNLNLVNGSQVPPDPAAYPEPPATDNPLTGSDAARTQAAVRFLNQATFGASPADVAYVKANGFGAWIDDQLTKPASHSSNDVTAGVTANINTPYPSSLFTDAWWKYSITGQDQLRQRLAFALSEIMVISWADNTGPLRDNGRVLADYYDQLVDYCLPTSGLADSGNFRGTLKAVTLTPAMGLYLDMRGNQKEDLTIGRHPNENYAREIMQLFSVGLNRRWDDGRLVLNANAELVPTYTQPTILGLAALLTGWTYAQPNQANGRAPTNFSPGADYLNAMVLVPSQHDNVNSKLLLDNVVSPAATGLTPRVTLSSITAGTPCVVNTATEHGLQKGDTVRISGVSGGTFSAPISAMLFVTNVVSPTSFNVGTTTSASINLTGTPTYSSAAVTGATVTPAGYTSSLAAVTGSQSDSAGTTLPHPYDQYGLTELDRAIDNICNNDNVPPYICRQLIQRLVTSHPSPGYVYRVVQKWKNNGSGVRGDLAAVVRQILIDGEARSLSAASSNIAFGKQREPVMRLTGPARAFAAAPYSGSYTQLTGVNSNKLRITTSVLNDFSAGFTVNLDFRGNYTATNPPNPYTNPTSTNYSVASTLGISRTWTPIASIGTGNPCPVTTTEPHGLSTGDTVRITGLSTTQAVGGTYNGSSSSVISGTSRTVTVTGVNTFTITGVDCTAAPTDVSAAKLVSSPCRITTAAPHGLTTGDRITITGISGGTISPSPNNSAFDVTVVDATSFTIPVNCTAASTDNTGSVVGGYTLDVAATGMTNATYSQAAGSNILTVNTGGPATNVAVPGTTVNITSIAVGTSCLVTTASNHKLDSGGVVTIAGVSDGAFSAGINGTFVPTVLSPTTFTIPVECTDPATTGTSTKNIRSRVYLHFLTQTTTGGASMPANGVYDLQSRPSGSSFTVLTTDTPTTGRGGNVLLPKISTSYTPQSSNTVVQFNTNVNHNMLVGQNVWVDVPVVGSPLTDAEYTITTVTDEDHFKISYLPASTNGGTYPKPSGSNNGITLYPLVPPPLGRSGTVTINQSTFSLGSTESTLTQSPLNAPTVFNYFFPDYKYPGMLANSRVDSPEFQLTTDTNVSNLTNSLTNMFIGTGGGNGNLNGLSSFNNGNGSVVMDIGEYLDDTKTSNAGVPALVDELANLLMGGPLETATRTAIVNFVANSTNFPMSSPTPTNQQKRDRVRAIIHLIITSAEYAVQK